MQLINAVSRFYYDMTLSELQVLNSNPDLPDISNNSLLYLDLIHYTENCTASKLAQLMNITKPAVTAKVNELIRQGLVCKTASSTDRRVSYLHVSDAAHNSFLQYDKWIVAAIGELEHIYTPEQVEIFCNMLVHLSKSYAQIQEKELFPHA